MYAVLGTLEFELITYFDGMETRLSADYAEHSLIGQKPRLQFTGDGAAEIRIDLAFHAAYCNPAAEFARLELAMQAHRALAFVLGSGEYKGRYVITELSATARQTDKRGRLVALEASMGLKEFTGGEEEDLPPGVQSASAADALPVEEGGIGSVVSDFAKTVSQARSALATASAAVVKAQNVVAIAKNDPLSALALAEDLLPRELLSAIPGMSEAATSLVGLAGQGASIVADARAIASILESNGRGINDMALLLAGVSAQALPAAMPVLSQAAGRVADGIESVRAPLAKLAAQSALRLSFQEAA
jgi:phage protein U